MRFHCTIQPQGLPALAEAHWGADVYKELTLHVLVGGREAMCDVGSRLGGTGLGDCSIRFDLGGTPRVPRIETRVLQTSTVLRLQVSVKAVLNAPDAIAIRLVRGAFFLGCVPRSDEGVLAFEGDEDGQVGCVLKGDSAAAAGFWKLQLNVKHENRGYAIVAPAARRVDLASNELYDVRLTPSRPS